MEGTEEKSYYNSAVSSQDEEHAKVAANIRPSITTKLLDGCTDFITVAPGESQDSHSKTVMIASLSPADSNAEETNTLNRNVQNKAVDSDLVKKYDIKIQELEGQLMRSKMLSDMERNDLFDCLDLEDDTLHTRHAYVSTLQNFSSSGDYKEVEGPGEAVVIEKELEHSSNQDKLDRELQELNKCLERKEKAIDGLKFNLSHMSSASGDRAQRLKKAFVQTLNFLEAQVSELKKKQEAHSQLPRQKQISDDTTRRLQEDSYRINTEFQLQPKITHESEEFRLWKAPREKEFLQVLQRKTEEASIATKKLKEPLEARKASSSVANGSSRIQTSQHLGTVNAVMFLEDSILIGVDSRTSSIRKLEGDHIYSHTVSDTHQKVVVLVDEPAPVILTICGLISRCDRLLKYLKERVDEGMTRVDLFAYVVREWIRCRRPCIMQNQSTFFIAGYNRLTQAWALYMVGDGYEYPHPMTIYPGFICAIGSGGRLALPHLERWKQQCQYDNLEIAIQDMETALVSCSLKENTCGGELEVLHLQKEKVDEVSSDHAMYMLCRINPVHDDPKMAFLFDLSGLEDRNYKTISYDLLKFGWISNEREFPIFFGELKHIGTDAHKCNVFVVYLNRNSRDILNEGCHNRQVLKAKEKSVQFYFVKNEGKGFFALPGSIHDFANAIWVLRNCS